VLQFAAEEADRLLHNYIGTEHLLLGILREERSVAASILMEKGMRLNTVREDIVQLLNEKTTLTRVKETPLLAEFSRDLTESAMKNQLDPLVGREHELERVQQVLCRRTKNNAVLIGEPGVGKTAIVEGLAQKIVYGDVPHFLADKRILALDISLIVAGTKYRDQFAAEFHSAGGVSIEIITQPGLGPVRYFTNFRVRDDALTGTSPFVSSRGPERNTNFGGGMNGALIKDKSSFGLFVFGVNSYDTPNLNAVLPTGSQAESLKLRTPRENLFVNGQMDYAVTLDQTLRFGYNLSRFTNENLGVGGYDEPERAYSNQNRTHNIRVQHFGPVGRRAFSRSSPS